MQTSSLERGRARGCAVRRRSKFGSTICDPDKIKAFGPAQETKRLEMNSKYTEDSYDQQTCRSRLKICKEIEASKKSLATPSLKKPACGQDPAREEQLNL
jgi:hypothetical protein